MKKIFWAGLAVVLAGGALIAATALDKKKATEAAPAEKTGTAAPASETAPVKEEAKKSGTIGAPTVEPVVYGKADAPIIIEEFASFTCSHCAHFHKETLPKLTEQYLDKGIVQLHMYSFVRNEQDLRATELVYCVEGNEQRQRFTKALLQAQEQWAFSNDFLNNLRVMAQVGGVSNEQFDKCMARKEMEDKILQNREYANGLGISSTPFFVIGKEEIKGAQDIKAFDKAIADMQKK